jgi:cyanuric acid amidohydrolase
MMMRAGVHRFTMRDPSDVSQLASAIDCGAIDPATIVAFIGKTEGNGLVNDFTRGYLVQSLSLLLASRTGRAPDDLLNSIAFIFSGGTEGVLAPHYTVFCVDPQPSAGDAQTNKGPSGIRPGDPAAKRLAIGRALTRAPLAEEIGTRAQADLVADAVTRAMAEAGLTDPEDVHFVQVKGGCVTAESAREALARGAKLASADPNRSMTLSRVAGAFGVMKALGELADPVIDERLFLTRPDIFSTRASVSSGIEVSMNEVVVFGNSNRWNGDYVIAHHIMADALDIGGIYRCLDELAISCRGDNQAEALGRIACALVKCEPDSSHLIRGQRHTMWQDGDLNAQRHIRGAVGGLVAGVLGDTRIFVSGGAEHQGPPGGGLLALIARVGEPS